MFGKTSETCVCAFCKLPHRVYTKTEVSVIDALIVLLVTALMAYAIWGGPDLRSMLILMGMTFLLQVFLRVRYRESVKCPHCGFDPILYKQDSERAAQKVKAHMEKRKDNPQYLLKPQPQIKPIYKTREEIQAQAHLQIPGSEGVKAESLPPQAPETWL